MLCQLDGRRPPSHTIGPTPRQRISRATGRSWRRLRNISLITHSRQFRQPITSLSSRRQPTTRLPRKKPKPLRDLVVSSVSPPAD
jgi:hypothetical protein